MKQEGKSQDLEYIDALRGIAILGVVMVHSSQQVRPRASSLLWFMTEGARGVQLFFVVSALTLCISWMRRSSEEKYPVQNFYTRRFFRIAPLFYAAIFLYLLVNGVGASYWAPDGIHWWFIPVTAIFLHGWHPEIINSVVPGGWSVAAEMMFYTIFPLVVTCAHSIFRLMVGLVLSFTMYWCFILIAPAMFDFSADRAHLLESFPYLSFWGQLPVFLMGMLLYRLQGCLSARGMTLVVVTLILFACAYFLRHPFSAHIHHFFGGCFFAASALLLSAYPLKIIVNAVTIWFGKLSFSIYLVHFLIINAYSAMGVTRIFPETNTGSLAYMTLIAASAAAIAIFTKMLIEDPFIAIGARLIARRESVHE